MATPPPGRKTRTLCVFHEKGSCRHGEACRFTHGTSDKRELPPQGGKAAGRVSVSVSAAEESRPASAPSVKNKKPCRFFVKGKCSRGRGCPFLHSSGDDSGSSVAPDGNNDDEDKDNNPGTTGKSTITSKVKVKAIRGKAKPAARVDSEGGDDGAPPVVAAKRAAAGEAAAGAAPSAARIKPRLGGSSPLPFASKVQAGGAAKAMAAAAASAAAASAGSWAGIVKRTTLADSTKRTSTASGDGSTTSTGSTGSVSGSDDGDMSAAVTSAAARVKALKAAHQAAKKVARAAAAAASASASAAYAGAAAAAAVADNARSPDTFGEPTTNTADRKQRKQQQACSTSGSGDKHKEKKNKTTRVDAKPCAFFLRGRCRYGDGCRFSHDVAHESQEEEEEDPLAAKEAALDEAERIQSRKAECGVCLEVVRKSDRVKGRTFGILMGCRHIYCLSCITEWRDKSKSHECPECRVPSPLVVPSKTLVTDPDRKARLVSNFRRSLAGVG